MQAPNGIVWPLFDATSGQRLERFTDIAVSSDSRKHEEFWSPVNPHSCNHPSNGGPPDGFTDGAAEYAGVATAAAHVIGRVTCPHHVHGKEQESTDLSGADQDLSGKHPSITAGTYSPTRFFHIFT